jgi:hypothetical protein
VRLLLDAHINAGTAGVPVALDTHRAPVTLSRIAAHDVLFRWVDVLAAVAEVQNKAQLHMLPLHCWPDLC